ncbi:MAG: hypothetical protein WB626_05680, partial [Bacteroidota bacterium]
MMSGLVGRALTGVLLALAGGPALCAHAQGSAGTEANIEPRRIVDLPTAGILPASTAALEADLYQEGGVLLGVELGLFDRLHAEIWYGGSRVVGTDDPAMNRAPGFHLKVRVLDESPVLPAVAIGFDSQGKDGFLKDLNRYRLKSPGFYAALSRNYALAGHLSIHGGVNYTLERGDGDRDVNLFAGAEKSLGPALSLL